jgi:hypothetical protein
VDRATAEPVRAERVTKPAGFDNADGGAKILARNEGGADAQPEVRALRAEQHPCDGYSPLPDAGAVAGHQTDGGVPGWLAPEVIQKLVRNHFGAMRLCYEYGMRRNRNLAGRVTTKFVIGLDGSVTSATLQCTSIPDDVAVDCVVNEFGKLKFPAPDHGKVTVIYPIMFNPGN